MILLSSEKVYEYFLEYVEKGEVVTLQGFYKFLLLDKKFSPTSFRDMQRVVADNVDILKSINAICEGDLVTQALIGLTNPSMSQFILKNKHGYVDKTEVKADVTFDKPYLPLKDKDN